jgi:hypothetical protein
MRLPLRTLISTALAALGLLPCGLPAQAGAKRTLTDVASEQPSAAAGYYALVIGIAKYKFVHPLATPDADAQSVAKILRLQYGFQTRVLLDVGRSEILDALADYRRLLPADSNLLIYYAGHGKLDPDVDEAYWLPVDARPDRNDNWISADDITRAVRAIPSRHVLVISDSCYSGAILGDDSGSHRGAGGGLAIEYAAYISNLASRVSKDWMASGSREPVEDGGAPGHSVFAQAFIQGLSEMNEPRFPASDLFYRYVRRKVGGNSPQLPQYGSIRESGDQLGDFIFARRGIPALPIPDSATAPTDLLADAAKVTPVSDTANTANTANSARTNTLDSDTPYTPFDPATEQASITAVLRKYEDAYNRRDPAALWLVLPKPPTERFGIESSFKNASSIRMQLTLGPADFSSDHRTATVTGRLHEKYVPRAGASPPEEDDPITFTLKKSGDAWTISDVR